MVKMFSSIIDVGGYCVRVCLYVCVCVCVFVLDTQNNNKHILGLLSSTINVGDYVSSHL